MGRSSGREALHFLRTMRWADTIVLAGGSHFHDRYGTRSLRILLTFIVLFGCARALGARVCYAGVGIGPFRGRLPRVAMRALVRVADGILVRDAPSAIEARRAGAAGVIEGFDSAVLLAEPDEERVSSSSRTLGLSLIPFFSTFHGAPDRDGALVDSVAAGIDRAYSRDHGFSVKIFSLCTQGWFSDTSVSQALLDRLPKNLNAQLVPCEDPRQLVAEFRKLSGLLAFRYHAEVLAYVAGIPCIPVIYDDKCANFAAQVGTEGLALDPEQLLDPDVATQAILRLLGEGPAMLATLPTERAEESALNGLRALTARMCDAA